MIRQNHSSKLNELSLMAQSFYLLQPRRPQFKRKTFWDRTLDFLLIFYLINFIFYLFVMSVLGNFCASLNYVFGTISNGQQSVWLKLTSLLVCCMYYVCLSNQVSRRVITNNHPPFQIKNNVGAKIRWMHSNVYSFFLFALLPFIVFENSLFHQIVSDVIY